MSPADGEILISLNEGPSADGGSTCGRCGTSCRKKFPELTFFFAPSDIVTQVLNFGIAGAGGHPGGRVRQRSDQNEKIIADIRREVRGDSRRGGCAGCSR